MSNKSILTIITRINDFPPLPAVVTKLMQITANPNSTADDLMKTISIDPVLAATILKLANSAFFGRVMAVSSLKEAIAVLGFSEIRNLVLSKAVFSSFKHLKKNDTFDIREFWEHSFLCGLAARIIAADLKQDTSDFFIAGLIHDIGKLIFFMAIPEQFLKTIKASEDHPFQMFCKEKKIIGVTHDEVGRMLLNKWLFPETLLSAVGYHHRPGDAKRAPVFPVIVNAADMLVHMTDNKKADSGLMKTIIHPGIIKLLNSHKITWNVGTLKKHQEKLDTQRLENADMLNLLLS